MESLIIVALVLLVIGTLFSIISIRRDAIHVIYVGFYLVTIYIMLLILGVF